MHPFSWIVLGAFIVMTSGCTAEVASRTATSTGEPAQAPPGQVALNAQMEERAGIRVETVKQRSLASQTVFSSTIEAPTNRAGMVIAPVRGIVTRVLADVGERVSRGEVVAVISSPDIAEAQAGYLSALARVQEAQAQIQLAEGQVTLARAEVERETALYKKGISSLREQQVAQAKLNSVQSLLAAARSTQAAARSTQAAGRARLRALNQAPGSVTDELPLRSPITGTVVARTIQPGQMVNPDMTGTGTREPLFKIAGLDEVWALLEVPQSEVASLRLGAPVQFTSEVAPGETFRGRVVRLGEQFDEQARTVAVRVAIANPRNTLKPGMLVLARAAVGGGAKPVLAVPNSAIQQLDGQDVVFVRTTPHTYKQQAVQLGRHGGQFTEVVGGLAPGLQVVSEGSFILKSETIKASLGED